MNRSLIALLGIPFFLAACDLAPVQPAATPVVVAPGTGTAVNAPTPGSGAVVVTPGSSPTAPTVVVNPTTVVSTDISSLAGNYDRSANLCNGAPTASRVALTPSSMNIGGRDCQITGTARDGSAIKVGLACTADGATRAETVAVTRTARGITLRQSNAQPTSYLRCQS